MGTGFACLLVFAAKLGLFFLLVTLVNLRAGRGGDLERAAEAVTSDPYTLAAVQGVAFGGVLLFGLLLVARDMPVREALRLRRPRVGHVLAAVVTGVALALALSELDNVLREFRPLTELELEGRVRLLGDPSITHRIGLAIAIAVVAPLTEEALFRGLILGGLTSTRGPTRALVVTSVLFGLAHVSFGADLDWPTFVVTGAAGFYLGAIALASGSITPAILIHATHNAVALLHPSELRVEGLNVLDDRVHHLPPQLVAASIAALVLAALFFRSPAGVGFRS